MPYLVAELQSLLARVYDETIRLQAMLPYAPEAIRAFDQTMLAMQARALERIQNPQTFRSLMMDEDQTMLSPQARAELYRVRKQWLDWAQVQAQTLQTAQAVIQTNQFMQMQAQMFNMFQQSNEQWNQLIESLRQMNWETGQEWISVLGGGA